MPSIGCVNAAAEILGSKWSAQIIREFAAGPKHFCELERALPRINPATLTKRLDDLRAADVITQDSSEGYSPYRLTPKGQDLVPILENMASWARKYPRDASWNVA